MASCATHLAKRNMVALVPFAGLNAQRDLKITAFGATNPMVTGLVVMIIHSTSRLACGALRTVPTTWLTLASRARKATTGEASAHYVAAQVAGHWMAFSAMNSANLASKVSARFASVFAERVPIRVALPSA